MRRPERAGPRSTTAIPQAVGKTQMQPLIATMTGKPVTFFSVMSNFVACFVTERSAGWSRIMDSFVIGSVLNVAEGGPSAHVLTSYLTSALQ